MILSPLSGMVGPLAIMLVAGLDMRFGWLAPVPVGVQVAGTAGLILWTIIVDWAMVANEFLFAMPLMLGSFWALVPGVVTTVLLLVRTDLEERTL